MHSAPSPELEKSAVTLGYLGLRAVMILCRKEADERRGGSPIRPTASRIRCGTRLRLGVPQCGSSEGGGEVLVGGGDRPGARAGGPLATLEALLHETNAALDASESLREDAQHRAQQGRRGRCPPMPIVITHGTYGIVPPIIFDSSTKVKASGTFVPCMHMTMFEDVKNVHPRQGLAYGWRHPTLR